MRDNTYTISLTLLSVFSALAMAACVGWFLEKLQPTADAAHPPIRRWIGVFIKAIGIILLIKFLRRRSADELLTTALSVLLVLLGVGIGGEPLWSGLIEGTKQLFKGNVQWFSGGNTIINETPRSVALEIVAFYSGYSGIVAMYIAGAV